MAYFGLVGNKKVQEILQKLAYYAILLSRSPFFMANPVPGFKPWTDGCVGQSPTH